MVITVRQLKTDILAFQDCRSRLMVRQNHPTIDNSKLALDLLEKFSGLWEEPQLDEVRSLSSYRHEPDFLLTVSLSRSFSRDSTIS
jgi:hypothetical protein